MSWGDSLTQGAGGAGTSYPSVLSGLLSRAVTNMGVGGETSSQIAARAGGRPVALTAAGAAIPGDTAVTVTTAPSIPSAQGVPISGAVVGVRGTLTLSAGVVSFRRQEAVQGNTACPANSTFTPDAALAQQYTRQIIWAGRNNYTDAAIVLADIAAIVAFGRTGKYVVLSVLNGAYADEVAGGTGYKKMISLNQQLAATYGANYLDIRRYLIDQGLADAGITPTAQDSTDIGNDVVPSSLRSDNIHLNAAGYTVVAQQVAARIQALGY